MATGEVQHIIDWPNADIPAHEVERGKQLGPKSAIYVPLVQRGISIGSLAIGSTEKIAFSDQDIALAQSFCDQAVIALRNTQLFIQTQQSLEQQTASAEILSVISQSVETPSRSLIWWYKRPRSFVGHPSACSTGLTEMPTISVRSMGFRRTSPPN